MRCRESSSSFFPFEFISPHRRHFRISKNTVPPDRPPPGREVRLHRPSGGIRTPCSEYSNRLASLLNADVFPLQKPRLKHGEGVAQVSDGHGFHNVDKSCPLPRASTASSSLALDGLSGKLSHAGLGNGSASGVGARGGILGLLPQPPLSLYQPTQRSCEFRSLVGDPTTSRLLMGHQSQP